ncbi:MAG TPA: SpoIIE family protein phosphatase, partial [Ktedonobacterales bacterium]|nr:SpoIIE family protein phosphatase [Ktedonobacterales bacterium]
EMRVARLIQQTLLPKELPALPGWRITAYYQPARAVGGDFYDFVTFGDGRLGIVIGDVTDKWVPAALVMATTRSILRSAMQRSASPGQVLEQTNDLLYPDIPPKMFVTCLCAILDPNSGRLRFANAGHDLPFLRHRNGPEGGAVAGTGLGPDHPASGGPFGGAEPLGPAPVEELRATGMPLGLMLGMRYEEKEVCLTTGDSLLFYSDGLAEAHNSRRELFGFPAVEALLAAYDDRQPLIEMLLDALARFTGPDWEQKDDVTLVTVQRSSIGDDDGEWHLIDEWSLPSVAGNEQLAMQLVSQLAQKQGLAGRRLEQLETAVAEATMNAMEHGNHFLPDWLVTFHMLASATAIRVRISDQGGGMTRSATPEPDIDAKLAGLQSPRGWGLFLIKNLVDDMRVVGGANGQTIELTMFLEGDGHDSETI